MVNIFFVLPLFLSLFLFSYSFPYSSDKTFIFFSVMINIYSSICLIKATDEAI